MVINKKKNVLLKKSFNIRQIADIFYNSKYLVVLEVDNFNKYEKVRKVAKDLNIFFKFLNKNILFFKEFSFFFKGTTLLLASNEPILEKFQKVLSEELLDKNIILLKVNYFFVDKNNFRLLNKNYLFNEVTIRQKVLSVFSKNLVFLIFMLNLYKYMIFKQMLGLKSPINKLLISIVNKNGNNKSIN